MRVSSVQFLVALWMSAACAMAAEPIDVDYNRDVRPILSDKCYRCHGPDEGERQTDLRLDDQLSAFALLDSGTRALVAGDLPSSELVRRIVSDDPDIRMPPPDSGRHLTISQIEILKRWVAKGGEWGSHWSFVIPQRPKLPEVHDRQWPENAIDHFVLSRLESANWQPSECADKRTLIRRATLTLTGLPPTPVEVKAFLQDSSPKAYEILVDRLLQSPRYGEHEARYWLDVARYGDTHGLHLDNERSIWRYRDWVIDAYNQNMPFDQFTVEQLAGDLLPNATLEQKIATGFHRCNVTTSEGGAIAEEFLARYAVDRVETTSAVWMGLTTGCAACHDHKFDPISQKEFYQLFAYFYNLTEKAMDGNALLPPPSLKAPTRVQQIHRRTFADKLARIDQQLHRLRELATSDRNWEATLATNFASARPPVDAILHFPFDSLDDASDESAASLEVVPGKIDKAVAFDGDSHIDVADLGDFERTDSFSFGAWINIRDDDDHAVLSKMHDDESFRGYDLYLSDGKAFVHLVNKWNGNAIRVNTKLPVRKEKWQHVFATYDGSSKAKGVKIYVDGQIQELDITHDTLTDSILTEKLLRIGKRTKAAPFVGMLDELQIFGRELSPGEVEALANSNPLAGILATPVVQRTAEQDVRLVDAHLLRNNKKARILFERRAATKQSLSQLENQFPSTLIMQDRAKPRDAYLLVRGQYDQKGEKVLPAVPAIFNQSEHDGGSRLSLAKWLVGQQHPLTARVTVNRIWQQHFGVGLVRSSEDFGSQGEWPSHPKLLDYLATELVTNGWDIKSLHRSIVTSATFQQSAKMTNPALKEDPENRLLSHGPRFRLDAESIRDLAMVASGMLVGDIGGPSAKPYQPIGLWKAVGYTSSNTANFKRDDGARLYRRGMYTFWKRTSPPPSMQILDAPSREVCTIRRPRTNTPAAALLLMNDVQFVEAAKKFAERLLVNYAGEEERLNGAYEIVLSRPARDEEKRVLQVILADGIAVFERSPDLATELLSHGESVIDSRLDRVELAAWTVLASAVLNLDEALNQH